MFDVLAHPSTYVFTFVHTPTQKHIQTQVRVYSYDVIRVYQGARVRAYILEYEEL